MDRRGRHTFAFLEHRLQLGIAVCVLLRRENWTEYWDLCWLRFLLVVVCSSNTFVHFMLINVVFVDMCLSHFAYANDLSCAEGSFGVRLAHTAHSTHFKTQFHFSEWRIAFMPNVVNAKKGRGKKRKSDNHIIRRKAVMNCMRLRLHIIPLLLGRSSSYIDAAKTYWVIIERPSCAPAIFIFFRLSIRCSPVVVGSIELVQHFLLLTRHTDEFGTILE